MFERPLTPIRRQFGSHEEGYGGEDPADVVGHVDGLKVFRTRIDYKPPPHGKLEEMK